MSSSITKKIFSGFHFQTPEDRFQAEKALWIDLPSVILITGPRGSGKTTLALEICHANKLQNAVLIGLHDARGYQIIRRSGRPIIIDNFKPSRMCSIATEELMAFLTDPTYPERKLGTTRCRKIGITNSLVIITTAAEKIPLDLARRIDLVIGLAERPETFASKRKPSTKKGGAA